MDSGYQESKEYHVNSDIPIKKSKHHPLSKEERAYNRRLARERVAIEHVHRRIKIFKILRERYRTDDEGICFVSTSSALSPTTK
jgi:IS5 family transposase